MIFPSPNRRHDRCGTQPDPIKIQLRDVPVFFYVLFGGLGNSWSTWIFMSSKLFLVGGFEHGFYFPFHIWDVILPIDELHHFSRWLLHHQPDYFSLIELYPISNIISNFIYGIIQYPTSFLVGKLPPAKLIVIPAAKSIKRSTELQLTYHLRST